MRLNILKVLRVIEYRSDWQSLYFTLLYNNRGLGYKIRALQQVVALVDESTNRA
jgi:hypothetical protein